MTAAERFAIGDRVYPTPLAIQVFPSLAERHGTVAGFRKHPRYREILFVQVDGNTRPTIYHMNYWQVARPPVFVEEPA